MPRFLITYTRIVERLNYGIGRFAMYLLFALMGILLWSTVSKALFTPSSWTLEMAQFVMVAYYVLGGPYSLQLGSNVRMDLLYGRWSDRQKALMDSFSILALIFYLGVLLYGAIDSTVYSLTYNERSPTAWRPHIWPIKIVMCVGFALMILQSSAILIRDIAKVRGEEI